MENRNYYPLRVGNNAGTIVTDVPTRENMDNDDLKYYGGNLVAESISPKQLAQQLVEAYNEKYGVFEIDFVEVGKIAEKHNLSSKDAYQIFLDIGQLRKKIPSEQNVTNDDMITSFNKFMENVPKEKLDKMLDQMDEPEKTEEEILSELVYRDITDADLIQTALTEGSITLAQSIQLMEVKDTPGFKNLFIQMQYDTTKNLEFVVPRLSVAEMTPQQCLEYMANQPARFIINGPKVLSPDECENRVAPDAKNRHQLVTILQELNSSIETMFKFIGSDMNIITVQHAANTMIESIQKGHKLLSCGNGGSYSDAQHFASELSGKYRGVRPAIAAIALSDGGAMSCIANDFGFNHVFERQVHAIGRQGDVLLCLSTSGNSNNVILAASNAQAMGITTVGICGNSGGALKKHLDIMIEVPHSGDAGKIQEITIMIIHILVNLIERGVA